LQERVGFFGGFPGVLGLEDVVVEVVFEDVDAASVLGVRMLWFVDFGKGRR
jgi:hypothetical protein